jgi:hypothetical protein
MIRDPNESPLDHAVRKLERALAALEQKMVAQAGSPTGGFDQERAKLEAELERSRDRERKLEEAGAAASDALGRAIEEIRSALSGARAPERAQEAAGE